MAEQTGLRNNALPYPIYAQPFGVTFPLLDADGDPISPSSPDSEVSKNGDTFADCTNEATEIATSSGICYLLLTATEMTSDVVTVRIQSTGAKTTVVTLYPRKLVTLRAGTAAGGAAGSITLDSGASAVDDFYNGCVVAGVLDSTNEVRVITDYVGSTKVASVTPNWNTTPDSDDTFTVYLPEGRQIDESNVKLWNGTAVPSEHTAGYPIVTIKDGTGTGEINTNAGAVALVDLVTTTTTATNVTTVNGLAAGVITAAAIATGAVDADALAADAAAEIADAVWDEDATAHQTQGTFGQAIGDPGADTDTIFALVNTIASQTDDIGAAGAGLTAVPWNAAWDAEVQSEVQDAIEVNNLDHLVKIAVDTNFATTVHLDSVIGHLADGGTTATFDRTTDSLEALQAEHDATQTAVNTVDDFLDTEIAAIKAKTDQLTFTTANRVDSQVHGMEAGVVTAAAIATGAIDADALAADVVNDIFMGTALTEAYATDGSAATPAQLLYMIYSAVMEFSISGTTLTCKKLDGSTTAMTVTLNDATNPTSRTRSG